jgi:hypothetical protein
VRRPARLRYLEPRVRLGMSISFGNLRRACTAAMVPLEDPDGWALPDGQLVLAVEAAREDGWLVDGAVALQGAIDVGALALGSRVLVGPATSAEVLMLAAVLRSPVADEAVTSRPKGGDAS